MGTATRFPRKAFAAIFPDDCHLCGLPLTTFQAFPVCESCIARVRPIEADCFCERCGTPFVNEWALDEDGICRLCLSGRQGFDSCSVFGTYDGELRDLIHLFKYGRVESLAKPLANWMLTAWPSRRTVDCVVPVPMHWWKRWRRGFNQSERLGREIARMLHLPFREALRRPRVTPVQAGLASAARRKNARHSYSLADPRDVHGKAVLLVDDVFTTGATATACARLLKRGGATSVDVLALARVDRRAPLRFAGAGERRAGGPGILEFDETLEAEPLAGFQTQGNANLSGSS